MRITRTLRDRELTWVVFQSTLREFNAARQWCEGNRTMWVTYREPESPRDLQSTTALFLFRYLNQIQLRNQDGDAIVWSRFTFRSERDAMMFKLTWA